MAQVKIPFDEKEAVRYFGAKKDDREAARLVDEAFIALRNEVQPRAVKRRLSCRVTPPCDGGMGRVELEGGTVFESNQLANHLLGCPEVILLGPPWAAALISASDASVCSGLPMEPRPKPLVRLLLKVTVTSWKRNGKGSYLLSLPTGHGFLQGMGIGRLRIRKRFSVSWSCLRRLALR
ncbi:MAG: hypothetical protein ACLVLA_08650 [Acidaminococcus intestini]